MSMNKYAIYGIISFLCISMLPTSLCADEGIAVQEPAFVHEELRPVLKPKVAVIYLMNEFDFKQVTLDLVEAAKDKEIEGILLIIHHYGGAMDTFSALHDVIKRITTIKPVVGLVSGSALSCGYLLASATDHIIVHSCSEIGNIGVSHVIQKYRNPKLVGELEAKIDVEVFQAGEFKTLYNTYSKELTDQDRKYIKEQLDKVYKQFLRIIANNRNLSMEDYKLWAEGKSFLAPEALQLGLVDEIGTIFEAIQKMLELIGKRNKKYVGAQDIEACFYEHQKSTNN